MAASVRPALLEAAAYRLTADLGFGLGAVGQDWPPNDRCWRNPPFAISPCDWPLYFGTGRSITIKPFTWRRRCRRPVSGSFLSPRTGTTDPKRSDDTSDCSPGSRRWPWLSSRLAVVLRTSDATAPPRPRHWAA